MGRVLNQQGEHKSSKGLIVIPFVGAIVFAIAYFVISTLKVVSVEEASRDEMIKLTSNFVTTYAQSNPNNGIVPAEFRRLGLENYNRDHVDHQDNLHDFMRMTGTPGLEIGSVEQSDRIRQMIAEFASTPAPETRNELRLENASLVGRTIVPSIANAESCVSCHNAILGADIYEIGQVMGAFVVETDLTTSARQNAWTAFLVFFATFVGAALLTKREQKRMSLVVAGLQAQVRLDRVKADAQAQQEFLLSHDPLTNLPNRSLFRKRLDSELIEPDQSDLVIAILDLDDFKTVNDTMGHNAGDALLIEVANRLRAVIPKETGLVARLGGDEFAAIVRLRGVFDDVDALGEALVSAMQDPLEFEDNEIQPACSIGLTLNSTSPDGTVSTLMRHADAALYEAKSNHVRRFRVFDDDIRALLGRRMDIAARLPDAIKAREFRAVLQPKIELATGSLYGFEALARWQSNDEAIMPDEFIPIAEKTGAIRDLDLYILRAAAEFTASIIAGGGQPAPFSTNLSALNFRTAGLVNQIMAILADTHLPPHLMTLEVTETAAVENWNEVAETLSDLRSLGVRISLDDFGTGYSSLSYLRRFAFEELKIDRTFITNIVEDAETRFLFESICNMAKGIGCTVVVEGIETQAQAEIVRRNGAQIGQGYLFSRPLELPDARAFIKNAAQQVA